MGKKRKASEFNGEPRPTAPVNTDPPLLDDDASQKPTSGGRKGLVSRN